MNLKEAKIYALDELKLERDFVRTFGKLTATQTWLDAVSAVEAAQAASETPEDIRVTCFIEATDGTAEPDFEEAAEPLARAESDEAAASVAVEAAIEPAELILISEATAPPEDSLIAFWESEPEQVVPQPLTVLLPLDEAWDDPEPRNSGTAAVVVYPLVVILMMLWAIVQVLLLGGKVVCWMLTQTAQRLDAMAQERLQRQRESDRAPAGPAMSLAIP